jgi:hypothetical protein
MDRYDSTSGESAEAKGSLVEVTCTANQDRQTCLRDELTRDGYAATEPRSGKKTARGERHKAVGQIASRCSGRQSRGSDEIAQECPFVSTQDSVAHRTENG